MRQKRSIWGPSDSSNVPLTLLVVLIAAVANTAQSRAASRHTTVSIVRDEFHINGKPTYAGRTWNGHKIQGLLLNSRMVQGIFDDRNPDTTKLWAYPDTGVWDAERNTREFIAAMPEWRSHGLLAFTLNLQGGSPQGYSKDQPWQIEVELRRKGELALLLPFRLTFADGSVQDLVWTREEQQAATWKRLEFESESKLVSAVIDPERRYFLDRDMSNDRWFDETDRVAPWRWAERVFSQYQRYLFWISGLGG